MGAPTPPKAHRRPGAAADPGVTAPEPATEATGLTAAEAAQRLRTDGPNALGTEGRRSLLRVLISQ
ncbi:MAG TPA: cation-transporting P-type ATPase, partial [Candidatus Limnocylindrales bacterium]